MNTSGSSPPVSFWKRWHGTNVHGGIRAKTYGLTTLLAPKTVPFCANARSRVNPVQIQGEAPRPRVPPAQTRTRWNWPHESGSSASFVLGKQKLHGKHAQMASLSHLLALLLGSIRQQLQWHDWRLVPQFRIFGTKILVNEINVLFVP